MTGRYGVAIIRVMRLAAAATVLGLVTFIAVMVRREKRSTLRQQKKSARPAHARFQIVHRQPRD